MQMFRGGVVVVAVAALALSLISSVFTTEYVVGDGYCNPALWGPRVSCDYNTWALQNSFSLGDSLVFKFEPNESNVAETSKDAYENCVASGLTPTNTIRNHSSSPATIVLNQTGTSYLISTVDSACNSTQLQLAVTVSLGSSTDPTQQSPIQQSPTQSAVSPPAQSPDVVPSVDVSPPSPSSSTDVPPGDGTRNTSSPAPTSPQHKSTPEAGVVVGVVVGTVTISVSLALVIKCGLIKSLVECMKKKSQNAPVTANNNVNNNNVVVNLPGTYGPAHEDVAPLKHYV